MTMLLPFIQKQADGLIWRIEIDALSDTIFLEERSEADKKVSFSSINLKSGELNFTGLETPERWLTGMEGAFDGILLLHHYQSEKSPAHKAVIAINNKAETVWSNYTYAFNHMSQNGPILFNSQIQPRKLFLADVHTGAILRNYEPVIDNELANNIIWPNAASADIVKHLLNVEPHGNIVHSLDYNNFRIVSLHTLANGQLKQQLYIWHGNNLVYEDLLATGIQKMQPESFMLYKNWLIFIKNKCELKVINL